MTATTPTVELSGPLSRAEVARLLLARQSDFDAGIRAAYGRALSAIEFLISDDGIELPVFSNFISVGGIVRWYIRRRRQLFESPGKKVVELVRARVSDGGRGFCKRIDFCRRRQWIREQVGAIDDLPPEGGLLVEEVGEEAIKVIEDLESGGEFLDFATEAANVLVEELGDYVVPGLVIMKVIKYGLDDLCPCCKRCGGRGEAEDEICGGCDGDGLAPASAFE